MPDDSDQRRAAQDELMDGILAALALHPPPIVFKYASSQGLRSILESRSLWATSAHYFNDRQELRHGLGIAEQILRDLDAEDLSELSATLIRRLSDRLPEARSKTVFVVSFSEEKDLLSQWRGYCPPAGGFSIGFSTAHLQERAPGQGFRLARCIYEYSQQKEILASFLRDVCAGIDQHEQRPEVDEAMRRFGDEAVATVDESLVPLFLRAITQLAPLFKDAAFSEEKEWRLISRPCDVLPPTTKFRTASSHVTPYLEFSLDPKGISGCFSTIVVGPGQNAELARRSAEEFVIHHGLSGCSIEGSAAPYRVL